MGKKDEYVDLDAKIRIKKSALEGLNDGKLQSNNGIRDNEGHLNSFVDVVEIKDSGDNECEYYVRQLEELARQDEEAKLLDEKEREEAIEFIGKVTAGLVVLTIFLSKKENREVIKSVWNDVFVPKAKGFVERVHNIKWFRAKRESSTELADSKQSEALASKEKQKNERIKKTISSNEFRQRLDNIKLLALQLAAEIEDISKFTPNDDIPQEELLEHQEAVRRLTTKETINFIEYLIDNSNTLDLEETAVINFRDFVARHKEPVGIEQESNDG